MPDAIHYKGEMSELFSVSPHWWRHLKVVINAAGKTDLKKCEESPLEAWASNVELPLQIFRMTKSSGATYIHVSSGCLWDGPYDKNGEPFEPRHPPSPASFYSWTKASVDSMMLCESQGARLVILRPRQLYSGLVSPRNTLVKLMNYESLIDTPNSMTSAETVYKAIMPFLVGDPPRQLVMNVYDLGVTSPYKVGMMLHEAGLRKRPLLLEKADLDVWHKPRRVDAVIKDDFFEALVSPPQVNEELSRNVALLSQALGRSCKC